MPGPSILTLNQFDEFDRRDVLCLRGLLSADRVCRAREYVQDRLMGPKLAHDPIGMVSHRGGALNLVEILASFLSWAERRGLGDA